jgi:hypothetical protein
MVAAHTATSPPPRRRGSAPPSFRVPRARVGQTRDVKAERDWDVIAADFLDLAGKLGC